MTQKDRRRWVKEVVLRNSDTPTKTIARMVFAELPNEFSSLEHARKMINYMRKNHGSKSRSSKNNNDTARENGTPGDASHAGLGMTPDESSEFGEDTGVVSTRRRNVRTLDELLSYMRVDLSVWEVERHVINKWEVGGKPGIGNALVANTASGFAVEPLYQVKAWLKRRVPKQVDLIREVMEGIVSGIAKASRIKPKGTINKTGVLCEVDIFDPHFGKLCWHKETGKDWDLKIASATYAMALDGLLDRVSGYKIERFLYPIGNDFFHVDTLENTTTAGTLQDCDGRWQKGFIEGRVAVERAIRQLSQIAPVDVVMVSGNHDQQKVFYLGEVLSAAFGKDRRVTVNNEPPMRKYYRWGRCLIGFTHGDKEKHADLPLIMATEQRQNWADIKFAEFHLGHFHKMKEISFLPVDEQREIRVRILSSLTPPDAWHKKMGYENLRASHGFIWEKEAGCVGTFSYHA